MRKQFKDTMLDLAEKDERIVLIFGDISVYLFREFQSRFPDRFFNMGICEATLVSVASGLSSQGFIPVVHSIAPFVTERAMEQIKLDFVYNKFPGNIVSTGATFDYAWDGATHHAWMDLGALRMLPSFEVIQPGSKKETDVLLRHWYASGNSTYFRLSDHEHGLDLDLPSGKGIVVRDTGAPITVVTAGPILKNVYEAISDLDINLLYYNVLKPFDRDLIRSFQNTEIKVIHDSFGLFEAVCECTGVAVAKLGLPDQFCCSYGTIHDVRKIAGLDVESIRNFIQS